MSAHRFGHVYDAQGKYLGSESFDDMTQDEIYIWLNRHYPTWKEYK